MCWPVYDQRRQGLLPFTRGKPCAAPDASEQRTRTGQAHGSTTNRLLHHELCCVYTHSRMAKDPAGGQLRPRAGTGVYATPLGHHDHAADRRQLTILVVASLRHVYGTVARELADGRSAGPQLRWVPRGRSRLLVARLAV
jgi:hypothetical protein